MAPCPAAPLLRLQTCPAQEIGEFDQKAEEELVRLTHQERKKAGLALLEVDERLTRAAREHSLLLAQYGMLDHQFSGEPAVSRRLAAAGLRFDTEGENVALDETVEGAHQGLMASPGHRANILKPEYSAMGIGVVRDKNKLWVTQDFVRRLESYTGEQAEDIIARQLQNARKSPRLRREPMSRLKGLACRMAREGELKTNPALGLPQVRYVVAYTASQPARLPEKATRPLANNAINNFAVAACFATSSQYPGGIYWVLLVFY